MILGILVNTDRHLDHITGITKAAVSMGYQVMLFAMDDGTKLLDNPDFCSLSGLAGVQMSFCRHNSSQLGVAVENVPENIVGGSQLDNVLMVHNADKLIIL